MTGPTLKEALRLVETLGLAPLDRIANTRPKNYRRYDEWNRRRGEVEKWVFEHLTAKGAVIALDRDPVRVRFAGIAASSTQGLGAALRNWKAAAEKGLKHWGNGQ